MVIRPRPLLFAISAPLVFVALACGGASGDSAASSQASAVQPTARATTNGPQASIDPRGAPPGSQVIVSGSGFPASTQVSILAESAPNAAPYAQVSTDGSGAFTARFRLEKAPDGTELKVGRFGLIARAGSASVTIPFLIETSRPVRNPGDGG